MNIIKECLLEIIVLTTFIVVSAIISGILVGIVKAILRKILFKKAPTKRKVRRINNVVYNIDTKNKTLQEIQAERKAMYEMLRGF